jgi:hypothetical protein
MGLFGSSPQKKLAKAQGFLAGGDHYEALRLFEDLLAGRSLSGGEESMAREGAKTCRRRMIERRLEEAELLRQAGDLESARDRCRTALDLAGEDLDRDEIEETMRRIDAPRRPLPRSGQIEDAVTTDVLPEPDRTVEPVPSPVDHVKEEPPEPSDEELFGEDPMILFEIYAQTLPPQTSETYRALGRPFILGYVALTQGAPKRALELFGELDWTGTHDPHALLEKAQALLLAHRAEEALVVCDEAKSPEPIDARRRYLRVEALRALNRYDEAVEEAFAMVEEQAGGEFPTESLLAWTLIEAGRAEEAYERMRERIRPDHAPDEYLVPAAAAAGALGLVEEEIGFLETLIQKRMFYSASMQEEIEFPVEAGRRLLDLYKESGRDAEAIRGLALHLIDHDPERAEIYRELLLDLDGEE